MGAIIHYRITTLEQKEAKAYFNLFYHQKVSEYDQEIPQSHTADQSMAPLGRGIEH